MAKKMNLKDMIAVIGSHQDQEVEDAKVWLRGTEPDSINAQAIPLWQYCCADHPHEITDTMSRFALIGIRHVMQQLEAESPTK